MNGLSFNLFLGRRPNLRQVNRFEKFDYKVVG